MDVKKLTTPDWVVGVSGILLLVFGFFPHFGKTFGPYSYSRGPSFAGWLAVLIGLAMVAVVVVQKLSTAKLPELGIGYGQVLLFAGIATVVLQLLNFVMGRSYGLGSLDPKIGLFLSFLASIGLAAGGYLESKEQAEAHPTSPPVTPSA
jgi:peptidoglycan biosynthesis protein MviN/MurJ (putative lipid II flippase)